MKNEPKVENIRIKKNMLKVHEPKRTKSKSTGSKAVFKLIQFNNSQKRKLKVVLSFLNTTGVKRFESQNF